MTMGSYDFRDAAAPSWQSLLELIECKQMMSVLYRSDDTFSSYGYVG
jgi:hypothetical protein